tara:strand:+ start:7073 stop:8233 length:1161 start_codon:yes stop_codon:yes gene_type:complete
VGNKLLLACLLIFSFFLAFGSYDPLFSSAGNYSLIIIFVLLFIFIFFLLCWEVIIVNFSISIFYLFIILYIFTFSSVAYGEANFDKEVFNYKFFVCILFFLTLTEYLKVNPKYIHYSLMMFSFGVIVFVLLLYTFLSAGLELNNGRLLIFGENPNSTSSRFTIAFIYVIYLCFHNPFKWNLIRFNLLFLLLPVLFMVVQSGSRGSLLSLLACTGVIIYLSKARLLYKACISLMILLLTPFFVDYLMENGNMYQRLVDSFVHGGTAGRDVIWNAAIDIILENPLLGVGEAGYFDEVTAILGYPIDTHNLLLYIAACGGISSLILFLLFYFKLISIAFAKLKTKDVIPFALLLNITLIALKTGGVLTYLIMWYVFSLVYSYKSFKLED